jgi:hypothetical protein
MKTNIHVGKYLTEFFLERKVFQTKLVKKIKTTHAVCSVTFFRKLCRLWDNVEKHRTAGQVTNDNTAHAPCMLGNYGYRHTLGITALLPLQGKNGNANAAEF